MSNMSVVVDIVVVVVDMTDDLVVVAVDMAVDLVVNSIVTDIVVIDFAVVDMVVIDFAVVDIVVIEFVVVEFVVDIVFDFEIEIPGTYLHSSIVICHLDICFVRIYLSSVGFHNSLRLT